MLAILVSLVLGTFVLIVFVPGAEGPNWNTREPAIMRLHYPSQEEVTAKTVSASAEEKADGMKWIAEFLKPAAIPDGLDQHLLAMKDAVPAAHAAVIGSGYPGSPPGGIKMTSGFLVKYQIQGYAFQIMETRGEVIVGVLDLNTAPARTSEADRTAFVSDIIRQFIKPQPADPFIIAKHLPLAAYGIYSPVKRLAGPEGNYALDPEQMARSPFSDIKFATDGKGVIFEAHKNLPFPADYMRPRFAGPPPPR